MVKKTQYQLKFKGQNRTSIVTKQLMLIYSLFLMSCQNITTGNETKNVKEFYPDGALKSEIFKISDTYQLKISFFENGTVSNLFRLKNGKMDGEQVWFLKNGTIDQKVLYSNGVKNGNAYFFYPSGTLRNTRFFKDGKENLFGADYWDDTLNIIKSSLHFNEKGEVFYKKNFDKNGNLLNEEGRRQ